MTIADVELFLVPVSCLSPPGSARSLVVRLVTDSGLEGWGEAQIDWQPDELAARRNALLPVLVGRSVFDIEELVGLAGLRWAPLRCAVEIASWDIVGRAAGQPLCHLFGGGYRQRIPLAVRLAGSSAQQVAQLARELAEQGFHSQIVSSFGQLEQDLELVAAIRQLTQDRAALRLDGAGLYDMETARDLCSALESVEPEAVLDPLQTRDLDQIASLRRQTSVRLAVWRSLYGPSDVLGVVRCGAATQVVVDLQRVGGLAAAKNCAAVAQAAGLEAFLATGPSVGLGTAAMLQLAAATPVYSFCHHAAHPHTQDDLLLESLEIVDGMVAVPHGPGLGVEINRAKLDHCQIG